VDVSWKAGGFVTAEHVDDYVEIVRYVRVLDDAGAEDPATRRFLRALRPDDGLTLEKLLEVDTLEPIVLVAPSGSGKSTELLQAALRVRMRIPTAPAARSEPSRGRGPSHSERSDARSQFLVSVTSGTMAFFFRIEPPRSVTTCALWTRRSQMASAIVASPIA